ncbi:putative sulfate transporter 3.5 isoform X2 [Canna indica]|uniref:Sulfate transporter 3.5 isoform X2 n=1 Tax=Canna indica TaxID=4628 RepID=A0AAQ3K3Y1_9LILI|nr:putative sulfate transporter 3.5 isoform X2 [Canna indica]
MIPVLEWAPRYNLATFQADLLAGVTVAILAVPQGISYARLANLHPIVGLCTYIYVHTLHMNFTYCFSTNVAVGNTAAVSLFLGSAVSSEVSPSDSPELYMCLLFTAAFFTGVFEAALGLFRLGILVEFFSRSTITGFMGGTAMVVMMQQLKGVLGMQHFTNKTDVVSVMSSIFCHRDEWRWESAVLGICFISFLLFTRHLEGIAVGRSLAAMKNEQIDANKEMIAFGLMNVIGSCFSCYLTTGPFSKSAVNYHAGSKTAMSNVIMSMCIMLVLLFLAPLFKYTPLVALSAIIIVAMVGLIEYEEAHHLFKVDKFDFVICMAAFFGVVFFSMTVGLLSSVGLSILRALLYVARPTTCKLGNIAGTEMYCDVQQYPNSIFSPDILILQLGSPVYYASAGYLKERIMKWIEEEETIARKSTEEHLRYLVLDMSGVTSIDNTGISMLLEVHRYAERRGIKIALTNPRIGVEEKLKISRYIDLVGEQRVFLSVKEAVEACRFAYQESKNKEEINVYDTKFVPYKKKKKENCFRSYVFDDLACMCLDDANDQRGLVGNGKEWDVTMLEKDYSALAGLEEVEVRFEICSIEKKSRIHLHIPT